MLQCYKNINMSKARLAIVDQANEILEHYEAQGLDLTLRQLYYQFVARGLLPNKGTEYDKLGETISDARLNGLIDWNHIVDRTRFVRTQSHWDSPSDIVEACAQQYKRDLWEGQTNYVEVWIEKDALVGVIEDVCNRNDVPYFSCRGYTSQSEMWAAAQRFIRQEKRGRTTTILHLGDHDPSGIDMTRDIQDRLSMFCAHTEVQRIALTMDQVREFNPPPNPAKLTDSRCRAYMDEYGDESWELDALEPQRLIELIETQLEQFIDRDAMDEAEKRAEEERAELGMVAAQWDDVVVQLRRDEEDE
jgi:hypothetical protein